MNWCCCCTSKKKEKGWMHREIVFLFQWLPRGWMMFLAPNKAFFVFFPCSFPLSWGAVTKHFLALEWGLVVIDELWWQETPKGVVTRKRPTNTQIKDAFSRKNDSSKHNTTVAKCQNCKRFTILSLEIPTLSSLSLYDRQAIAHAASEFWHLSTVQAFISLQVRNNFTLV